MATAKTKVISVNYFKGRQSHEYREVLNVNGHCLQIDIKRDSYDFQSHARISAFDKNEEKWNVIHSIPYPLIKMKISYMCPASILDFKADRNELVRVAKALFQE